MAAAADVGLGRGTGTGSRPGAGVGPGAGGLDTSAPDRHDGGAKEKKPQVSKVSVGTQARSKVLVRQSTADAAVNCPEEKEEKKGARRNLPKQLSMDPSILACPQPMFVESAIPLSLDPILPGSTRPVEPAPFDSRAEAGPELPDLAVEGSLDLVTNEPVTSQYALSVSSKTAPQSPQENVDPADEGHSDPDSSRPDDGKLPDSGLCDTDKIQLPYPVPVVTVSPPEEHDNDIMSDYEDEPDPVSQDPAAVVLSYAGVKDPDPEDATETEPTVSSCDTMSQGPFSVCDAPTLDLNTVKPCNLDYDIRCPSIVVSEYLDPDSPPSPTDSDTHPDPIITLPDYHSDPPPEQIQSVSDLVSGSDETQLYTEAESQESEWPPLPEPLDSTPIYHADLVHFDLVMLTSLDQDDLDSVFMDPEPEPFHLSVDADDSDPPVHQSDCPSSPVSTIDPATLCFMDPSQSTESACSAHMPQDVASDPLPQVTVTISPPSSVSPDTSLEMDFGPTSPASDPPPDTSLTPQELEDEPSGDLPHMEPDDVIVETLACMAVEPGEGESPGSPERSSSEQTFLWCRWQKRGQRRTSVRRSASVELWSSRYEYNSAEITYVSLTL